MNPTLNTTPNKNMIAVPIPDKAIPLPQTNETLHPAISKALMKAVSHMTISTARELLQPQKILKTGRVTVVFWNDGTTTAVKCSEDTIPDVFPVVPSATSPTGTIPTSPSAAKSPPSATASIRRSSGWTSRSKRYEKAFPQSEPRPLRPTLE